MTGVDPEYDDMTFAPPGLGLTKAEIIVIVGAWAGVAILAVLAGYYIVCLLRMS